MSLNRLPLLLGGLGLALGAAALSRAWRRSSYTIGAMGLELFEPKADPGENGVSVLVRTARGEVEHHVAAGRELVIGSNGVTSNQPEQSTAEILRSFEQSMMRRASRSAARGSERPIDCSGLNEDVARRIDSVLGAEKSFLDRMSEAFDKQSKETVRSELRRLLASVLNDQRIENTGENGVG